MASYRCWSESVVLPVLIAVLLGELKLNHELRPRVGIRTNHVKDNRFFGNDQTAVFIAVKTEMGDALPRNEKLDNFAKQFFILFAADCDLLTRGPDCNYITIPSDLRE